MRRKLWICTFTLMFMFPLVGHSQMLWRILRYEAGIGLGSVHSFTDIGPAQKTGLNFFNGTRPNLTVEARYNLGPAVSVKLDLAYLMFGGSDVTKDTHYRPEYDWAYNTHAFEHTIRFEYYFFDTGRSRYSGAMFNRKGMVNRFNTMQFYVFAGAGGIMTKAKIYEKGNSDNELTDIEGYNTNLLWNPVVPAGIGAKYFFNSRWSFGGEVGLRYTFTDLLDGYADSYWGDYNDYYYLISVKAIYRIRAGRNGLPTFKRYGMYY